MHTQSKIIYFEKPGPVNTETTLKASLERAEELGIDHIVVASGRGKTAKMLIAMARESGYSGRLIVIANHAGFYKPGEQALTDEVRDELEKKGVRVHMGTHALSSVSGSFILQWIGIDMLETIAVTLRRFSQGIKAGIEISIMAADAGLIPVDRDVIAIAGTGSGADSSVVIKSASMNSFFDLKVREIIAMPLTKPNSQARNRNF